MRIFFAFAVLGILLPAAPPAAAFGGGTRSRCERQADTLATLEHATDHFGRVPGFIGEFLSHWFGRIAEGMAFRYADACVHLNQVQQLGTHNSYHIEPFPELIEFYTLFDPEAIFLQYTHRPLPEQFSTLGIRQIELDVYADPEGGLYDSPWAWGIYLGQLGAIYPGLEEPGTKVLHIQDLDWRSTCPYFVQCLQQILAWSDAHPGHLPIMILIEVKDAPLPPPLTFPPPIPFGAAEFDRLESEILSVFPRDHLITPDDVRGGAPTLEDAVLARGWPTLGDARGKVLFTLDNRDKRGVYLDGHPSLAGRLIFTDGEPGEADAAFVKRNDPVGNEAAIRDLIARGYIVRTRADADTVQARTNDPTQREAALTSAATYVSTDYAAPDPRFSSYSVAIPGGEIARCNPVNAPPGCRDFALDR